MAAAAILKSVKYKIYINISAIMEWICTKFVRETENDVP